MDNAGSIKSKILQFFTAHPLLGFIGCLGSIASIIGLLFSVFPWLAAARKDLSFCVNPVRTPIVQISKQSNVSVSYKGKPVNGNVSVVQIAVWNAGREPIKAEDVLTPIILHTATNQIMEASILKAARDVCKFQIDSNSIASNSISMKWRILEKNDGGLIQIVYFGDANVPVTLDGVLVGQPNPHAVSQSKIRRMKSFILLGMLCGVAMCLGALVTLATVITIIRKEMQFFSKPVWLRLFAVSLVIIVLVMILAVSKFSLEYWTNQKMLTPFGF